MHIHVTNPIGITWHHILPENITAGVLLRILEDLRKKLPENQYQFRWGNP